MSQSSQPEKNESSTTLPRIITRWAILDIPGALLHHFPVKRSSEVKL